MVQPVLRSEALEDAHVRIEKFEQLILEIGHLEDFSSNDVVLQTADVLLLVDLHVAPFEGPVVVEQPLRGHDEGLQQAAEVLADALVVAD